MKHASYEFEKSFYYAVAHGQVDLVQKIASKEHVEGNPGLGTLSKNALKNAQYHCVISTSLAARACIDNGLPLEEAFSLSDFYIQQIESCQTALELDYLTYQMNMDYTKRMQKLLYSNKYSITIIQCINYIDTNLHRNIHVDDIAKYVQKNRSYLSKQFKAETGFTIGEYIRNVKLEEAKYLLTYTTFTSCEIALNLGFTSQSHFTSTFKKYTSVTPK